MLLMGFQDIVRVHLRCRYHKLINADEKLARPKSRWVKKMNGGLKGLRLSRSRKVTLKAFSVIVLPSKIIKFYDDIINRIKKDDLYPNIIFSTQWGLPVLSHPSVKM